MSNLFEVCWMAVEPRYATDVEALLQSRRARDATDRDVAASTSDAVEDRGSRGRRRNNSDGGLWQPEEYDAFMATTQTSYRRVRAFGDVIAAATGQQRTLSAASAAAGITSTELRAALGKFTTWMNTNVHSTKEWPFGWAYGPDVDPENPIEFHYSMRNELASAWSAARESTPEPPR
jgi:hypothetical protein